MCIRDRYNSNLDIIFGDAGIITDSRPTIYQIERMFEELNKLSTKYDLIVIDLGAGVSEENLFVLSKSQTKIIVTNPEPTALMDAYVVIKLLKNNKSNDSIYIAINRCADDSEGKQSYNNLKSCLLYTSDAADERSSVDLGGRRIIKKKKQQRNKRKKKKTINASTDRLTSL